VWYGERAIQYIEANGRWVSLVIVGLLALGLGAYLVLTRSRKRETPID